MASVCSGDNSPAWRRRSPAVCRGALPSPGPGTHGPCWYPSLGPAHGPGNDPPPVPQVGPSHRGRGGGLHRGRHLLDGRRLVHRNGGVRGREQVGVEAGRLGAHRFWPLPQPLAHGQDSDEARGGSEGNCVRGIAAACDGRLGGRLGWLPVGKHLSAVGAPKFAPLWRVFLQGLGRILVVNPSRRHGWGPIPSRGTNDH